MGNTRYSQGWTDPKGIFGGEQYTYTYEVRREQQYVWSGRLPETYCVVKIKHGTAIKPSPREVLYNGLSHDAAIGYCKLLTEE